MPLPPPPPTHSILSFWWEGVPLCPLVTRTHSVWKGFPDFLSAALLLLDPQLLRFVTQCRFRPLDSGSSPNTTCFIVSLPASLPATIRRDCDQQRSTLTLYLYPLNASFVPKNMKIGRQMNAKSVLGERNGSFDSNLLSRQHAEVWEQDGKVIPHLRLLSPLPHEVDLTL
jgi:hypothetical protein